MKESLINLFLITSGNNILLDVGFAKGALCFCLQPLEDAFRVKVVCAVRHFKHDLLLQLERVAAYSALIFSLPLLYQRVYFQLPLLLMAQFQVINRNTLACALLQACNLFVSETFESRSLVLKVQGTLFLQILAYVSTSKSVVVAEEGKKQEDSGSEEEVVGQVERID